MSAQFDVHPSPDEAPGSVCPQCSTPAEAHTERCAACGYTLAGVGGRPGPYGRLWGLGAAALLTVAYGIALVVVLLGR
jgi:hypothetical protein